MKPLPLVQLTPDTFLSKNTPLRQSSQTITQFDRTLQDVVGALTATFHSHKIAVGLAAPQVGIQKRVCVINISKNKKGPDILLINPRIVAEADELEERFESCMSLPDVRGKVRRALSVTVSYEDETGTTREMSAQGFLARVIQHEIDHLNGVLYVDRMSPNDLLEPTDIFKDD